MRLFIGIPLGDAVAHELGRLTQRLKAPAEGLRWSAEAGWHITLQFLGKTREPQYACVLAALRRIDAAPFAIDLDGVGFFDRAGVFFADVRLSPELSRLERQIKAATALCGFEAEERPYHPHITLARSKGGRIDMRQLRERLHGRVELSSFLARTFVLYESFPDPGGSRYEVRERFSFSGSGAP